MSKLNNSKEDNMFDFAEVNFENVAEVGEKIQAYDFKPMSDRPDYYVIGTVIAKGMIQLDNGAYYCDGYTIMCEEDTLTRRVGQIIYVPFEIDMMDFNNRVRLMEGKLV